ncbi:MAG: hypothetical protein HUU47_09460 [Bacteroidetes bacterium]|nr:hypothetical protein [Bacteroidota bacterium]
MIYRYSFYLIAIFSFCNCKDNNENYNYYIPEGPVNFSINTDLPQYYYLKNPGTYLYHEGGNRGVILVHNYDDNFLALERTCSFEPDKTCSYISVDSTTLTLRCGKTVNGKWEQCCSSKFMLGGEVSNGPAAYNLRQYYTQKNGSVISVIN